MKILGSNRGACPSLGIGSSRASPRKGSTVNWYQRWSAASSIASTTCRVWQCLRLPSFLWLVDMSQNMSSSSRRHRMVIKTRPSWLFDRRRPTLLLQTLIRTAETQPPAPLPHRLCKSYVDFCPPYRTLSIVTRRPTRTPNRWRRTAMRRGRCPSPLGRMHGRSRTRPASTLGAMAT